MCTYTLLYSYSRSILSILTVGDSSVAAIGEAVGGLVVAGIAVTIIIVLTVICVRRKNG